jgi:hypothetical protein
MAAIDITTGGTTGHPSRRGKRVPYLVREVFTGAAATAANGAVGPVATDTIQTLDIPAETLIMAAGIEVTTADTGTTLTFDLGITGGNVDQFVNGLDITTTGNSVFDTAGLAGPLALYQVAADTLDIYVATEGTANDDWVVEVWAVLLDCSSYPVAASAKENFA